MLPPPRPNFESRRRIFRTSETHSWLSNAPTTPTSRATSSKTTARPTRARAKVGVPGEQMPAFPTSTPREVPPEPVEDWKEASSQAALTDALIYSGNVTTHCPIMSGLSLSGSINSNNVVILKDEDVPAPPAPECDCNLDPEESEGTKIMVASGAVG